MLTPQNSSDQSQQGDEGRVAPSQLRLERHIVSAFFATHSAARWLRQSLDYTGLTGDRATRAFHKLTKLLAEDIDGPDDHTRIAEQVRSILRTP